MEHEMMENKEPESAREALCRAVRLVAWGFVFMYLNVNLGTLNVLPDWAGYLMILQALPVLSMEEESTGLLRVPGILLVIWEGILWLCTLFGVTPEITIVEVIVGVLSLYFQFQLLTNLASIAGKYGCSEEERIRKLRTACTLLAVAVYLPVLWSWPDWAMIVLMVAAVIVALWTCVVLFAFRRTLAGEGEA